MKATSEDLSLRLAGTAIKYSELEILLVVTMATSVF
jgi:hypothetical protein